MSEEKEFWIIGHNVNFDFILIGENTGPYSEFPLTNKEARTAKGKLHYINNLVSQINGKKVRVSSGPLVSKCLALDAWNKNVSEPMKSFEYTEDVTNYLKELARPFFRKVYFEKEGIKILEDFSIKGVIPN